MSPVRRIDLDNRTEGLRLLREGLIELDAGLASALGTLRRSLRHLVEAFLEARTENATLFRVAHSVGALIERHGGCILQYDAEQDGYQWNCPITGLHNRVGFSIGGTSRSRCSICNANEFDCDHVPGRTYEGQECVRVISDLRMDHLAITANPDFAYTLIHSPLWPRADAEQALGQRIPRHAELRSTHCRSCPSRFGPEADDLDTSLWPPLQSPSE